MPNLFPEGYEAEIIETSEIEESVIGYKKGVLFDIERGDFVRNGANKMLDCTGIESWKIWCFNCINTRRYNHMAYSTDFGIDIDAAFKSTSRAEAESILNREITEALLADPYGRTSYIEKIEFEWMAADALKVNVCVHGIDDVTIDIMANLTKGEI